jgi:hypothetical protein
LSTLSLALDYIQPASLSSRHSPQGSIEVLWFLISN